MVTFWSKVNKNGPRHPKLGRCWLWTAYRDRDGYGLFVAERRRTVRAHRWAYADSRGHLPKGEPLDHLCRNRACVRPSHLELVTPKVNGERSERAMKTSCVHGHLFDVTNTYIKPNGCRGCRPCRTKAEARRRARQKAA